jgi:hypothetical protein
MILKAKITQKPILKIQLNPKKLNCVVSSAIPAIKCSIIKNYFTCSIKKNKIILKLGKVDIGNVHNHNNLYFQKEEAQEKLIYIPNYKMFLVN